MKRWTKEELNMTSDLKFAAVILRERAQPVNPYTPLGEKLKNTIYTLENSVTENEAAEAVEHTVETMTKNIMHLPSVTQLCEACFDILWEAFTLRDAGKVEFPEDSRELFNTVFAWGREFEDSFGESEGEYLDSIQKFAETKLTAEYGVAPEEPEERNNCELGLYDCSTCSLHGECPREDEQNGEEDE